MPIDGRRRILVTGGAGFVGTNLVDRLLSLDYYVVVIDDLSTGQLDNVKRFFDNPQFLFIERDICQSLDDLDPIDYIYHLACPASPNMYQRNSIKTLETCLEGTMNVLRLAKKFDARLFFASTSEVYGDPDTSLHHPQSEAYNGNVPTTGPRSCYDEGKRAGEAICYAWWQQERVDIRIGRIFNTYGPYMRSDDGRVISEFINRYLKNERLVIYGDGGQTRSFQYISDLVDVLLVFMMRDDLDGTILNLGNPEEYSVLDLAHKIISLPSSQSSIEYEEKRVDDPDRRRPDISKAKQLLGWQPKVSLDEGLQLTFTYFLNK